MPADIKFCGLTRAEDAREAARLGAAWVGVIFADSPRTVDAATARRILDVVPAAVRRVGVFGPASPAAVANTAREAGVEVVQLHGEPDAAYLSELRSRFQGRIWVVIRTEGDLPGVAGGVFTAADAVVIDARVAGRLGGTGVAVDWARLAPQLGRLRGGTPVVLAGGLTPENVADAIRIVAPDVVDVSSGVEVSPGIKDHERMRAFARAVRAAGRGGQA